jgi:hypothetical protein
LLDAGTLCRQLDVCLPGQSCTGASALCPPAPVDAGAPCDDDNVCSAGQCLAAGCSYVRLDTPIARGLLQGSVDAGVTFIPVPRAMSVPTSAGLFTLSTTLCPNGATSGECNVELDLTTTSFSASTTSPVYAASGSVRLRAPLLRLVTNSTGFGAPPNFSWGAAFGRGGCQGPNPNSAPFITLPLSYSLRAADLDGGVIGPITVPNLRAAIEANLLVCRPNVSLTATVENNLLDDVQQSVAAHVGQVLQQGLEAAIRRQICLRPVRGVCALGTVNSEGLCSSGSSACFSALAFQGPIPTIPACVP